MSPTTSNEPSNTSGDAPTGTDAEHPVVVEPGDAPAAIEGEPHQSDAISNAVLGVITQLPALVGRVLDVEVQRLTTARVQAKADAETERQEIEAEKATRLSRERTKQITIIGLTVGVVAVVGIFAAVGKVEAAGAMVKELGAIVALGAGAYAAGKYRRPTHDDD